MTEAAVNPTGDAVGAGNSGVADEQTAGVPAESTEAGATGERFDFEAKVREDPDFALRQVKENQSRADRLQGEMQALRGKLGQLAPYVEQLGGDQIAGLLGNYATLRTHPEFSQHVLSLEGGGQLPPKLSAARDEDEYEEPWEKALRERDSVIARLEQQLGNVSRSQGTEKFKAHVTSVLGRWSDLTGEDKQKIEAGVDRDLARMTPEVVSRLTERDIRAMVLSHLDDDAIASANRRRLLREQEQKAGAATDGPSPVRTTGQEPTSGPSDAQTAWREAIRLVK